MERKTKKISEFFQKNLVWILSGIASFFAVVYMILGYLKYLYASAYFNHYNINAGYFDYKNFNVVYNEIELLLLFIIIGASIISLSNAYRNIKNKEYSAIKSSIPALVFLIIVGVIFSIEYLIYMSSLIVVTLIFLFFTLVIVLLMISHYKEMKVVPFIGNMITYISIFIFVFSILYSMMSASNIKNIKDYNMIDGEKVILYTTSDYYIVAKGKIDKDKLVIDTRFQEKISNLDIETQRVKFSIVEVKK